jgi:hypothetical protein
VYGFEFASGYWIVVTAAMAGALVLGLHWRVWRSRRALRALLIIVTGSIFGGTALIVAANFFCARVYRASPLTFDIVSLALIIACMTQIGRTRLRRRGYPRSS